MKLFWPEKPCQPSLVTQGGSTRPVEPPALSPAGQSGFAQYLAPGTRKAAGTEFCSAVFARNASLVVAGPHGAVLGFYMSARGAPPLCSLLPPPAVSYTQYLFYT